MLKEKKWWHHVLWADPTSFFAKRKHEKIQRIDEKRWNYLILTERERERERERESLCIAWTTRRVSMNFSGKMWLIIIAKVCKSQGFTLSLEGKFLKRLQGGGGGAGVKQTAPDFLELKNPSPAQFLTSLNSHRYYWVLKLLIVTWKSEAWLKHRARLYSLY